MRILYYVGLDMPPQKSSFAPVMPANPYTGLANQGMNETRRPKQIGASGPQSRPLVPGIGMTPNRTVGPSTASPFGMFHTAQPGSTGGYGGATQDSAHGGASGLPHPTGTYPMTPQTHGPASAMFPENGPATHYPQASVAHPGMPQPQQPNYVPMPSGGVPSLHGNPQDIPGVAGTPRPTEPTLTSRGGASLTDNALGRAGSMPYAPRGVSIPGHWGNEEHAAFDQIRPEVAAMERRMEAQHQADLALANRNAGPHGYGGLGNPSAPSDAEIRQNMRQNGYRNFDRQQMQLASQRGGVGSATPVAMTPQPQTGLNAAGREVSFLPSHGSDGSIEQSRFQEGVPTAGRRTTVVRAPGGGLALIGSEHMAPSDMTPEKYSAIQAASERKGWDDAKARTDAAGGPVRPNPHREYDEAVLRNAAKYGTSEKHPAVARAMERVGAHQRQMEEALDRANGGSGVGGGVEKITRAANQFAKTDIGKIVSGHGADLGKIRKTLEAAHPEMSKAERDQATAWLRSHEWAHPESWNGGAYGYGHEQALRNLFGLKPKTNVQPNSQSGGANAAMTPSAWPPQQSWELFHSPLAPDIPAGM